MLPKFLFVSLLSFIICTTIFTHSYSQCLEHQKSSLLELKNELIFDSSLSRKLVQWNQTDDECCVWHGVECDGAGNVVSLQLDDESISGGIGDSSTLFRPKYLEKLNLTYNDFNFIQIPRGIHNLTYLTHLNLSHAVFGGQVPVELLSLRRLASLDISNSPWTSEPLKLEYPNLEMLVRNLTGLRELYLDRVDITSSHEREKWSHIVSSCLPHIISLSLIDCSLSGPPAKSFWQLQSLSILKLNSNNLSTTNPDLFANFTNLTILSLVDCELKGSFPNMIFRVPTLQNLDLSGNELLSGTIPSFIQIGSLKSIRLGGIKFSGMIPNSISNHKTLSHIDLSSCNFTSLIPSTFSNLTQLIHVDLSSNFFTGSLSSSLFGGLINLVYLDLGYNSFFGNIPPTLFYLPSLLKLALNSNKFTGQVEEFSVVNVSNIVNLDLSGNLLEGSIPDSLFQLHNLEFLHLSGNLFNGSFQLDKIQSLSKLTIFYLSGKNLSVYVGDDNSSTSAFPDLNSLSLTSCNLHDFPDFIKHSNLSTLRLSNNRISGEIPSWIWGMQFRRLDLSHNLLTHFQKPYHIPHSLHFLDMHSNQLKGELHLLIPLNNGNITSSLYSLILANNSLSESIPTSLCTTASHLDILDLSFKNLSGNIPPCLLENIPSVIDLGQNNISGCIPDTFPHHCELLYFDISNNTIEGKIPKSLKSCLSLEFMVVGNNILNDNFPMHVISELDCSCFALQ